MLVTRGRGELSGVAIKGIDPKRVTTVLDLHKHMVEGSVDTLELRPRAGELPPIILGTMLAKKLRATIGDRVTIVAPLSNIDASTWTSKGDAPKSKKFVISGIFYSGFAEYDSRLMYIHIADFQALLDWHDRVMGVELKVANVDHAARIAEKLKQALAGPHYSVQDWHDLNKNLFRALALQKIVLLIILTLITTWCRRSR
jgi:lipoprotein-releasing system permease protein